MSADLNPYDIPAPKTPDDLAAAAKLLGRPKKELLVLDPSNDPFNAGTPAKIRAAEWFVSVWQRFGYSRGVHCRKVHYAAQASGDVIMPNGEVYINVVEHWQMLVKASNAARDLALLDPELFDDRRNAKAVINVEPRDWQPDPHASVFMGDRPLSNYGGWILPDIPRDITVPDFTTGHTVVTGYDYELDDQPYLIELWIEKSTMDEYLSPLCDELGVNYASGKGFTSKTRIVEMLRRGQRHNKPVRVLILSDYDPAGAHMGPAIARAIEFHRPRIAPGVQYVVDHVGMTKEWAEKYQLPRTPIKEEDRRRANFEAIHGEGCIELDALEALHPGRLADEMRGIFTRYMDVDLAPRLSRQWGIADQSAQAQWRATASGIRRELETIHAEVAEVAGRYRERLNALADELQADLTPHRERLGELWDDLAEAAEEPTLGGLPPRPLGHANPGDESNVLFDTRRHWLDQLDRYRAEKIRPATADE